MTTTPLSTQHAPIPMRDLRPYGWSECLQHRCAQQREIHSGAPQQMDAMMAKTMGNIIAGSTLSTYVFSQSFPPPFITLSSVAPVALAARMILSSGLDLCGVPVSAQETGRMDRSKSGLPTDAQFASAHASSDW